MIDIKKNYALKELNTFGFNYSAEFFCEGNSVEECHEFIDFCTISIARLYVRYFCL